MLADSMSGRTSCGCCVSFWCLSPALPELPWGPLVCFVCKTDEWYILDLWIKDCGQRLRMRAKLMRNIYTSQNMQKHNASDPGSFFTKQCLQSLDGGCKCRECTGRSLKLCEQQEKTLGPQKTEAMNHVSILFHVPRRRCIRIIFCRLPQSYNS